MNQKLANAIKITKSFLSKRSPEILTGIGITGMITTTVLAVKATPKALKLLDNERKIRYPEVNGNGYDQNGYISPLDTVKIAWKPYIPAAVTCATSTACLIGASRVNMKRNAALATAYAISEKTLIKYKDKVIETIGERKEKEIREKISQDEVNNNPITTTQVILTPKGNTMFRDSISGRYFKSDMDKIKKAVIELNTEIHHQNYISLNEFYYMIGLEPISTGDYLGWNVDDSYIDIDYNACIAEDEPCIVIDFKKAPKYDFDKFA